MSDLTLPLSYGQRSMLLSALTVFASIEKKRDADFYDRFYKADVEAALISISRLECQPGGCGYCNADRAREEAEYYCGE